MAILIDGYNLLHASGILARNIGPGTLERAREGLVGFLAASLDESERKETTIVFDARAAFSALATRQTRDGITVLYAVGYDSADRLLEELISADPRPRRLVVVSGDREVQRMALRRRATVVESGPWYEDLRRRRRQRLHPHPAPDDKPADPATEAEVQYWLEVFGDRRAGEALPLGDSSRSRREGDDT